MGMQAGNSRQGLTAINMTPMVDIMLVLLVIFMVTSSAMNATQSIEVDKPDASSGAPDESERPSLVLTCDKDGGLHAGTSTFADDAAVIAHVRAKVGADPQTQAILRCDRAANVDTLVRLIDLVRLGGITRYAIAIDPVATGSATGS